MVCFFSPEILTSLARYIYILFSSPDTGEETSEREQIMYLYPLQVSISYHKFTYIWQLKLIWFYTGV